MRSKTVSSYFVNASLKAVKGDTELVRRLLAHNNIAHSQLADLNARVAIEDYANLLRDIMLTTQDELIGYGANPQPLGSWATMGQLVINSENLGTALTRLARFYRLIPWGIRTQISVEDGIARFSLVNSSLNHTSTRPFEPYLYESFLFYVYRMSNWLIAKQISLKSVNFCFPEVPYSREYRHLFLTGRIEFNCITSQLRFSADYLKEPIRQNEHSLANFLEHTNMAMMTQTHRQGSWTYRVESLLFKNISTNVSIVEIADSLKVHPHTLRSHLRREGMQFPEIKQQIRLDSAIRLLRSGNVSIEETAVRIGFSESSAFIRAFKKWTGKTPRAFINSKTSWNEWH